MGNIKTYTAPDGEVITYTYDAQGQLLKAAGDTTYTYTYDAAGNLLTASDGTTTHTYTYGNSDWKDLLTAYDGQSITYDTIGNPTSYFNGTRWSFTWGEGRQLTTASTTTGAEDVTVAYTYGADGIRTSKTVTAKTYHTHSYTSTVVPPTCEESGYTNYVCVCGYSYQDNVTAATGHSYTETVTAPTCTERGYTTYTCACGYSYTTYTAALGHNFPDDVVGVLARTCTRCGYQQGISTKPVQPILPPGSGSTTGDDEIVDLTGSENGAAEVMAASETDERTQESTVVTKYDYIYLGSQLVQMTVTTTVDNGTPTTKTLNFAYDASGIPATVTYDGATYYYITNLQGDVMAILNSGGTAVVQYEYDPWGNILATTGTMASTLGEANPLRYRGYVYDSETTLYYLQSRYYDPAIGRFINADAYASTGQGILGNNMFAYCLSNPINMVDHSGKKPGDWFDSIDEAARDAAYYINEASISEDTEYSSCIYTIETTRKMRCYFQFSLFGLDFDIAYYITLTRVHYSYTNPIPGTTDGVEIPDAPEGMESAAFFHTHASYNPYYQNDDFSWDDIAIANYYEVPIYVATPFGSLRRYDPADQTNIIVYNDIPYDRNHPYR